MRHVIWDWNGTLFDDLHVVIDAVNATIVPYGGNPITADDYRRQYTRPVRVFYDRLLDRPVADHEWHEIDDAFHDTYRDLLDQAGLNTESEAAIERVQLAGGSQSLLSMFLHEELVPLVDTYGLTHHLLRIDGLRGTKGAEKAVSMRSHVEALVVHPTAPDDLAAFVVIGDALDDAVAARENDLDCVLFASGSHEPDALRAMGYPVASSLLEALDVAGV